MSKFHEKGQIPWLGSKFRGPQKNVGPTDHTFESLGLCAGGEGVSYQSSFPADSVKPNNSHLIVRGLR